MTIFQFCRDQLVTDGPLSLAELTRRAVDAGVTRSRPPHSSVRTALAYRAIQLPDQRWASPLWLLEGRVLTTRSFGQSPQYDEDGYHEGPADEVYDLGLLIKAVKDHDLPLSTGGVLRCEPYGSDWRFPKEWRPVRPGRFQLLGLRIVRGVLHVEPVDHSPELQQRGPALGLAVARLDDHLSRRFYGSHVQRLHQSLEAQLWIRLATDPAFLTEPVPPFSECVPALEEALAVLRAEQQRQRDCWHAELELPRSVLWIAQREAQRDGFEMKEWLEQLVASTLRRLPQPAVWDEQDDPDDGIGEVLRFPRRG